MNVTILIFLVSVSVVLYIISRLSQGWVRLAFGWIAGGLFIIIGFAVLSGNSITAIDPSTLSEIPLSLGISNENFTIIMALVGIAMIYSSSGDWV